MKDPEFFAKLPVDEDLPGLGRCYCLICDRHFMNRDVLLQHCHTKQHKRLLKKSVEVKQYSQAEAEAAAGMGQMPQAPGKPH
jgi:hypothetical protein